MTHQLFLFLSRQRSVRNWMETSQSARKLTRRFVAGETLEQVVAVCERLRSDGFLCSLDHLGENVKSLEEAASALDAYLKALERIAERALKATISLKLTQMGLDFSEEACLENVRALVERARVAGTQVEIDMESTAYTDRTLDVVEKVAGQIAGDTNATVIVLLSVDFGVGVEICQHFAVAGTSFDLGLREVRSQCFNNGVRQRAQS